MAEEGTTGSDQRIRPGEKSMRFTRPLQNRPLRVLGKRAIGEIHAASLEILEDVGVDFENAHALQILSQAGCTVEGSRVKFPASIVTKAIESTSSEVVLKGRDPEKNVSLGRGTVHITGGFGATYIFEPVSNMVRKASLKDLGECTLLCDYLEHIDYCLKSVIPQDVPQAYADIHASAVLFANTDKHVHISQDCPTNTEFITRKIIELAHIAARDSRDDDLPFFSLGLCPHSPLKYTEGPLIRMRIAIETDIPFFLVSGAMAGVSSPATLAGTLVVQHAELLAGLVFAQLVRPGSEVIFGSFSSPADMTTGKMAGGSPGQSTLGIATQQLCDYCEIPYGYGTGGLTDSGMADVQAGYDKGISLALQMLGGVNVVHDGASGLLNSAMVMSKEQLVIDHEYVRMIAHAMKGIEVNSETMALELIKEVGPGGDYLEADHTLRHFRDQFFMSNLLDRPPPKEGILDQSRGIEVRAGGMVKTILSSHRPRPLPDGAEADMRRTLEDLPPLAP
jgi:trimethylamine--corrinoid protein Co-methyltransferase